MLSISHFCSIERISTRKYRWQAFRTLTSHDPRSPAVMLSRIVVLFPILIELYWEYHFLSLSFGNPSSFRALRTFISEFQRIRGISTRQKHWTMIDESKWIVQLQIEYAHPVFSIYFLWTPSAMFDSVFSPTEIISEHIVLESWIGLQDVSATYLALWNFGSFSRVRALKLLIWMKKIVSH